MCSAQDNAALPALGFPIRASAGHWPFSASPRLIAAVHALHRLLVPRHPPCALNILTVIISSPPKWTPREETQCLHPVIPVSLATVQFSRTARRRKRTAREPPGRTRGAPGCAPVSQNSTACGAISQSEIALREIKISLGRVTLRELTLRREKSKISLKRIAFRQFAQARSTFLVRMHRDR
jgi:hypothetical protein